MCKFVKCGFNVQKSQHEIPRPTVPAILALDHLAPVMARSYLILALRGAWEQPAVQRSRDERWIWFRGKFILQQIHSFPHVLGMEPNNVPISEIEIDWNHLLHGMDPRMRITELVIYRRSNSEVAENILPDKREDWKMDGFVFSIVNSMYLYHSLSFSIWLAKSRYKYSIWFHDWWFQPVARCYWCYNYGWIVVNIHMSRDMNLASMVKHPIITWTVHPSILVENHIGEYNPLLHQSLSAAVHRGLPLIWGS